MSNKGDLTLHVHDGETCLLCGDELTNDMERDSGVCDPCAQVGHE